MALGWSENYVGDPLSGNTYTIYGHDNETQARIAFATNYANYNLAQEQNKWNLQQWRRQNEYNSPQNQLRLLSEAGINPNTYQPQGMTAAPLESADLSVAGTPELAKTSDLQPFLDMMQGVGGVKDSVLDVLNSVYNAENLKAGIAESKLRQQQAKAINPLLVKGQELSNRGASLQNDIAAEKVIQERYNSSNSYYDSLMKEYDWQHYEEKFKEDLKLTKSSSYYNYQKAKEALHMIKNIDSSTDLNTWINDFRKRTGIDPSSDGVSQLVQLALSDPGHAKSVIDILINNIAEAGSSLWNHIKPW